MPAVTPVTIMTAYGIVCDAMKDVGKLRAGDVPDGEALTDNMRRLNKLVNYYMTQGLKLWLVEDLAITLLPPVSSTQGVALYTLGPSGTIPMQKPLRVTNAYYLDQNNNQRPLISLSYQEYKNLSNVLQPGSINSYMVDKQQSTLNVYFWMAPDAFTAANGTAHLTIEQSVTNFVSVTDQMNFPIEWGLLLEWGLADQISTGQPTTIIARAAAMEAKYREALENWDVEDADTMFQPDQRQNQYRGRFR
jgi:hypothetical protein